MTRPTQKKTPFHLESALQDLKNIVDTMTQGQIPLVESMAQFEKGMQLAKQCQKNLDETKQKVEMLVKQKHHDTLQTFTDDT